MQQTWTVGRIISAGVVAAAFLIMVVGVVAYRTMTSLLDSAALVAHTHEAKDLIARVHAAAVDAETNERGFILTGDDAYLVEYAAKRDSFTIRVAELRALTADNPSQQARIARLEPLFASRVNVLDRAIDQRRTGSLDAAARVVAQGAGRAVMDSMRRVIADLDAEEGRLLVARDAADLQSSRNARLTIWIGTGIAVLLLIIGGVIIIRSLSRRVGSAVDHIQRSSTELQAAAAQQASSAKEQAAAMSEINTTITELVATSRQIAEGAQNVARIAEQTASAARHGDSTVERGQDTASGMRRQVDVVVQHMLDLGSKSQQIGSVLEIVGELAEQTNILAINATIEASSAGESGRRFAVVADEIRRLADRVGNSTKEIRTLIEDVRGAVNTTVMATEASAKAVDAGARQYAEVAASFKQIATLVGRTTDASRQIELSTKQQATAAEQVRGAVTDVAQAARETEASTGQTLQTSLELTSLSRELLRITHPDRATA